MFDESHLGCMFVHIVDSGLMCSELEHWRSVIDFNEDALIAL